MGNPLIIDNWLLQDIGAGLANGLDRDTASEVVINQAGDAHVIRDVPSAGVQLEALLSLLVDIVFRDSLIIDSSFTDSWDSYGTIFSPLVGSGLIRALPFAAKDRDIGEARKYLLGRLCVTSTLIEEQRRNEESWAKGLGAADPYMSAVIWGTAGMLARSHVFDAPYSGHPLRKRVIEQTILATPSVDMVKETVEWINTERLRLFETRARAETQRTARLTLPPIVNEIIEEARDVHQLIPIAYQMRDKYAAMREWMNTVQAAMDNEDPKAVARYKKLLSAVSSDIDRAMGNTDAGKVSLTISNGWPSISLALGTIDNIVKKFGMRSMLNKHIFSGHGDKGIKKLLRMFDIERTSVGFEAMEYMRGKK